MSYKIIELKNWNRKSAYENFKDYLNPIFSISTRLDVTNLYNYCKRTETSFFTNFLFIVTKCLNGIYEFRLRFLDEKVVLFDKIDSSFIVKADNGSISTCITKTLDDYASFYKSARENAEQAKHTDKFSDKNNNALFYITCMPWVDIVSFSNPYRLNDKFTDCIPRLMWSKFVEENSRMKMTMDIAAHHALMDGEPVCRAFNAIQKALDSVEEFLI